MHKSNRLAVSAQLILSRLSVARTTPKIVALPLRGSDPLYYMVPRSHPSQFSLFAGLTNVTLDRETDKQTDHAVPCVTIGCYIARCNAA